MPLTKEQIIETIGNMTVLELCELVKDMERKFGVSATTPAFQPQAYSTAAAAPAPEEEEEKDSWTVVLVSSGGKKIQVIKEVRAVTPLSLQEAKALVDEAPSTIKEDLTKERAQEIRDNFEAVGATMELR